MNNKALATTQTYDPNDLTSMGYDVTLYGDGSVGLLGRNRWQGTRDGDRYRSDPETVEIGNDPDQDLAGFLATFDPLYDLPSDHGKGNHGFRQTRRGWIVR